MLGQSVVAVETFSQSTSSMRQGIDTEAEGTSRESSLISDEVPRIKVRVKRYWRNRVVVGEERSFSASRNKFF